MTWTPALSNIRHTSVTWMTDSSQYQTRLVSGIQKVITLPGQPFEYMKFLAIKRPFSVQYAHHHLNTVTIWIPNTWIPDWSEYRTWLGGPFEYRTFWTMNRLFSVWFSGPSLEYWTIRQPDTNLPFDYQTSPVFKWLLHWTLYHWTQIYHSNT